MIPVFPFGAAATASLMIRRRNEEEEKKKAEVPKSRFIITVDDEKIIVSPNVVNEFDWARAAWAMIKHARKKAREIICEKY